jgi:hypothetical protein
MAFSIAAFRSLKIILLPKLFLLNLAIVGDQYFRRPRKRQWRAKIGYGTSRSS